MGAQRHGMFNDRATAGNGAGYMSGKKKILVALSGGVDSAAAAALLARQGYAVAGVTMSLGIASADGRSAGDAQNVCAALGIEHRILDVSRQMADFVIQDFVAAYCRGGTPNPCVRCNRFLKFGALLEYARAQGFAALATGHYARVVERHDGMRQLARPADRRKDQTYFLWAVRQQDLPFVLFPLAEYTKAQSREIARAARLPVAEKEQSQDVCFIPDRDYKRFLREKCETFSAGDIVDVSGNVRGKHRGIIEYTVGQRSGLGIAAGAPLYVVALDAACNRVIVGGRADMRAAALTAVEVNCFQEQWPERLSAKIRYGQPPAACRAERLSANRMRVIFVHPQEAVAPGQSVVLYDGDILVAGGMISAVECRGADGGAGG
ncbi:MAG: tRNA 2-thiouridine(34) synthase MnmA [Candidatus Omnitrophica bacterium]|nr:tRNA 2-thiouridine(34) synthase MnmA [Candidatus Omnitrophota bacterium]